MGRKEQTDDKKRVEEVLQILKKKSSSHSKTEEKFCNDACVERFLKSKGDNVKKAAKYLRSWLSWRESIGTGFPKDVPMRWEKIAAAVPGKSKACCMKRVAELKRDFRSSKASDAT